MQPRKQNVYYKIRLKHDITVP